jgi:hypothetical protein
VIVVPVRRHDKFDLRLRVDPNGIEIIQGNRPTRFSVYARVNNDPVTISDMGDDRLAEPGPKYGYF